MYLSICIYVCVVVVVKINNGVTITCGTKTDEAVTWKFQGDSLDDFLFDYIAVKQNLTLSEVETSMLGEYSCWRGEEMLSSTYLLLDHEESPEEGETLLLQTYSQHIQS